MTATARLDAHEDDPPLFRRAAVAWHARWYAHLPILTLAEARLALAALEALAGPDPIDAARTLRRQSVQHGVTEVAVVLDGWLARREAATLGSHRARP